MTDNRLTWVDGDVLYADDLSDSILANPFLSTTYSSHTTLSRIGCIAHSSTNYSMVHSTGEIMQTADSGVTWTSRSTVLDTNSFIRLCRGATARGIGIEVGATAQEVVVTANSGATWTVATSLAFGTDIYAVDWPVAGLIVVGGDDAVGTNHIVWSSDQGTTWTDATTQPTALIRSVAMLDGTTGYAIDINGLVWRTTNSAVTWTSTTHTVTAGGSSFPSSMYVVSATSVIMATADRLYLYNFNTGVFTLVFRLQITDNGNHGFVSLSSGAICFGYASGVSGTLLRTTDSGTSWVLVRGRYAGATGGHYSKCELASYGDVVLAPLNLNQMVRILNPD